MRDFWENILGFNPKIKKEEHGWLEPKCYKCGSKNTRLLESPSWTMKRYCKDCSHYTFVIISDKMGGALSDSIAIDKRNSKMKGTGKLIAKIKFDQMVVDEYYNLFRYQIINKSVKYIYLGSVTIEKK